MADFIKNSFSEVNRFVKVVYQRGRVFIDFELNEWQDNHRVDMYRGRYGALQSNLGTAAYDPASSDDGYKIVGTSSSNAVTVKAGHLLVGGYQLYLSTDQTLSTFTTPGSDRTDCVYLAVSETEVADPAQVSLLGETTRRMQLTATLAISTTGLGGVPANSLAEIWDGGVHYFPLALVARHSGSATIAASDVTDLRYLAPSGVLAQSTRQANATVAALVGTRWETPDGTVTNAAEAGVQTLQVDVNNTQSASPRGWHWTIYNRTPFTLVDGYSIATRTEIVTAVLAHDARAAFGATSGAVHFTDGNTQGAASGPKAISLSGVAGLQDETLLNAGRALIGSSTPNILRALNGRSEISVGDGTTSYGDFTGTDAIQLAIAHINGAGFASARITVKAGTYVFDDTNGNASLNAGLSLEIVGVGVGGSAAPVISASSGITLFTQCFTMAGAAEISLENLTFTMSTTSPMCAVGTPTSTAGSKVTMRRCTVTNGYVDLAGCDKAVIEDCTFAGNTSAGALATNLATITLRGYPGAAGEHFVRRCKLVPMRNSSIAKVAPVCRIYPQGSSTQTMRVVSFEECTIELGCNTVAAGTYTTTASPGVLDVIPSGGISPLTVSRVQFLSCDVTSNMDDTADCSQALIRYSGYSAGDTTHVNGTIPITSLIIRGGKWLARYSAYTANNNLSPFCIGSTGDVTVEDITTGWTGTFSASSEYHNGYIPTEFMQNVAGTALSGGSRIDTATNAFFVVGGSKVNVRRCSFSGFQRTSVTGDAYIFARSPQSTFEECAFTGYTLGPTGSNASVPGFRVSVGTPGYTKNGANSGHEALLVVRAVSLEGTDTAHSGDQWVTPSSYSTTTCHPLLGIAPLIGGTTTQVGTCGVAFRDCAVHGFYVNGLVADATGIGTYPLGVSFVTVTYTRFEVSRCSVSACNIGIGFVASVATHQLSNILVEGNSVYSEATDGTVQYGILLTAFCEGVRIVNNSLNGHLSAKRILLSYAMTESMDGIAILGNTILTEDSSSCIYVDNTSTSALTYGPPVIIQGNVCTDSSGNLGAIYVSKDNSSGPTSITTPIDTSTANTTKWPRGIHTAITGASLGFTDGNAMVDNVAIFKTG